MTDPHANLSKKVARVYNSLIACRENPYIDQKVRGREAASILRRFFEGATRPMTAMVMVDIVLNINLRSSIDALGAVINGDKDA